MTNAEVWASLLLFALAGWAATNIFHSKMGISQANMLSTLEKLDDRMDTRINAILERARNREAGKRPTQPLSGPLDQASRSNPIADLFGVPATPFMEQPGAEESMEIAE